MTKARRTMQMGAAALLILMLFLSACGPEQTTKMKQPDVPSDSMTKPGDYKLLATPRWIFSWWERFKLVRFPGHWFNLGADPDEDKQARGDETPETETRIPAFYIMDHEVTNAEYMACVASGACQKPANDIAGNPANDNLPVTNVNHKQASAFCAWIDGRLPTEAEWEYAASGTQGRIFPWGNTAPTCTLANSNGCVKPGAPMPVGSLPDGATPEGLVDMAGNVREWVSDFYSPTAYQNVAMMAPTGPASGSGAVVRGGGFNDFEENLRTTARLALDPNQGYSDVGFRCVPETPSMATICPARYTPLCPQPGQPSDGDQPCTPGQGISGEGGIKIVDFGCPQNDIVCIIFSTSGGGSAGYNAIVNNQAFTCSPGTSAATADTIKCCGSAPAMGTTAEIVVCGGGQSPTANAAPVGKLLSEYILASYREPALLSSVQAMAVTNTCSEGYTYNPKTGECELDPQGDNCPDGWMLSAASGLCVPGSREACPPGTEYNDNLKGCDPLKDDYCPEGYFLSNREVCEPQQNRPNICPRGYYYDKRVQCCLPLRGDNYGCGDGFYWNTRYQRCLPVDQDGCPFGSLTNGYGACNEEPEQPEPPAGGGCPPNLTALSANTCGEQGGGGEGQGAFLRPGDQLNPVGLPEPQGGEDNQGECGSPNLTYYDPNTQSCLPRDPNGCPRGYYWDSEKKVCRPTNGGGSPCPPGYMYNRRLQCCTPIPGNDGATCPQEEQTGGSGGVGPNGYQSPALMLTSFDPQLGYCDEDTDPGPQDPNGPDCVTTYFGSVACTVCRDNPNEPICTDYSQPEPDCVTTYFGSVACTVCADEPNKQDCVDMSQPNGPTPTPVTGANNPPPAGNGPTPVPGTTGIPQIQCPPELWDEKAQACVQPQPECGVNQYFDPALGYCVSLGPDCCPEGQDFSVLLKSCLDIATKPREGVCPNGYELIDGICWLIGRVVNGGQNCTTIRVNVPRCQGGCQVGTVMDANGRCVKPSDPCANVSCSDPKNCPTNCCYLTQGPTGGLVCKKK